MNVDARRGHSERRLLLLHIRSVPKRTTREASSPEATHTRTHTRTRACTHVHTHTRTHKRNDCGGSPVHSDPLCCSKTKGNQQSSGGSHRTKQVRLKRCKLQDQPALHSLHDGAAAPRPIGLDNDAIRSRRFASASWACATLELPRRAGTGPSREWFGHSSVGSSRCRCGRHHCRILLQLAGCWHALGVRSCVCGCFGVLSATFHARSELSTALAPASVQEERLGPLTEAWPASERAWARGLCASGHFRPCLQQISAVHGGFAFGHVSLGPSRPRCALASR